MTLREFEIVQNNIISIGKFLSHYYYIGCKNINKLTHNEFTTMFNLKFLSIFDIEMSEVISGEKVLVTDKNGLVLAFENPLIIKRNEDISEEFYITNADITIFEEEKESIDLENIDFNELTNYELDKLLEVCKEKNNEKAKNKVIKELKFRPESKPGMRHNLVEKQRIRELKKLSRSDNNDKY